MNQYESQITTEHHPDCPPRVPACVSQAQLDAIDWMLEHDPEGLLRILEKFANGGLQ